MNKRKYLVDQLDVKIVNFKEASASHKSLYRRLRYGVFFLTAFSAFLAGAAIKCPELNSTISLAIVFVSAAVGAVMSIEGLRKPAELWIHERTSYYALTDLKREVEFKTDDNSPPELLEMYFFKMQEILGASGEKWSRFHNGTQLRPDAQPGGQPDLAQKTAQGRLP